MFTDDVIYRARDELRSAYGLQWRASDESSSDDPDLLTGERQAIQVRFSCVARERVC